jgi:hypothetical protein
VVPVNNSYPKRSIVIPLKNQKNSSSELRGTIAGFFKLIKRQMEF